MVGFRDLVGTGIAPVSKKNAVNGFFKGDGKNGACHLGLRKRGLFH